MLGTPSIETGRVTRSAKWASLLNSAKAVLVRNAASLQVSSFADSMDHAIDALRPSKSTKGAPEKTNPLGRVFFVKGRDS